MMISYCQVVVNNQRLPCDQVESKSIGYSYSGFIPNEALESLTPSQTLVYATIQFLSFFGLEVNPPSISKRLPGMGFSTIKNSLYFLIHNFYVKREGRAYEFLNHKQDRSKDYLTAKELSSIHKGYWMPLSLLQSHKLKPIDKITLSVIKNLIGTRSERQLSISFIAKKLSRSRNSASVAVNRLLEQGWISRRKRWINGAFYYRIGGLNMSNDKPYGKPGSVDNSVGESGDSTENSASNRTENSAPIYSSDLSNKYIIDTRTEREPDTFKIVENKALFFLKEVINYFSDEVQALERAEREKEAKGGELDKQYTQACSDGDVDLMFSLGAKMAITEQKDKSQGDSLARARSVAVDHLFAVKQRQFAELRATHIQKIGKGVKALLPDFGSGVTRKQAFCILMNSVVCDLRLEYVKVWTDIGWRVKSREDIAMNQAINNCLRRASKSQYRVNDEIALNFYQNKGKDRFGSDDSYRWLN